MDPPEQFLTIDQICKMFNYPPATILGWLERGLPHIAPGGQKRPRRKDVRVRASALRDWIKGLEVTRTPAPVAGPRPAARPRKLSAWRTMVVLGLLACLPHPAPGGSIGTLDLPPLHGRAPARVPDLTGPALVRFWQRHEFAPALRDPGLEVRLAEALTAARDRDPSRFDRQRPVVGHLLRDPAYLDRALHAYISHPARFTRYHHHLIPVLRGLALDTPVTPVITPVTPDEPIPPVEVPGVDAAPAPKSLLLLFLGLTGCALARSLSSRGTERTLI